LRRLGRLFVSSHFLALADQGVVSAASFLALILIGRWTDAGQLGIYAIGNSIVAILIWIQDALITRPYSIQLDRPLGTPAEHAFSALMLNLLLSSAGVVVLGATALLLSISGAQPELPVFILVLAAAIPFVLLREFGRRFAFAHLKMGQALCLDLAVAGLAVCALAWLGGTGELSAQTAFGALAGACAFGSLGWLYLTRHEFAFRLGHVWATLRQSWGLGRWLLSNHLAVQMQGYANYWVSMVIGGAAVTGIYAACTSIVSFTNPLVFGFFNLLTPRSVRILRTEGPLGLRRQVVRDALGLGAVMTSFCLLVALFGEEVMHALYPGPEYAGHGDIVAMLAVAATIAAVGAPAAIALTTVERARAVATIAAGTAVLSVVLVCVLMSQFGLVGAAYALVISETAGCVGRWTALLLIVPKLARAGT
jgi:O-antigen/teichoic acid export membrane protein